MAQYKFIAELDDRDSKGFDVKKLEVVTGFRASSITGELIIKKESWFNDTLIIFLDCDKFTESDAIDYAHKMLQNHAELRELRQQQFRNRRKRINKEL